MMSEREIPSPELVRRKLLGAVGLAAKARRCVAGTQLCVETMRSDKGVLLAAARDISDNTKKRLFGAALAHRIPFVLPDVTKAELAHAAGKKADAAAVLFMDEGFVKIIDKLGMEIHTTNTEVLNLYGSKHTEV